MNAAPNTLQEAILTFADPKVAFETVRDLRWPNGPACPICGCNEYSFISTRFLFKCKACKKQYSVKTGSIFEDSPLGLDKWLIAIWLIANAKNGISSYEIHRALGITQKSAWFVLHRIRLAMRTKTFEKLSGRVEADETYIGGKAMNMHKSKRKAKITSTGGADKTMVFGMVERGGGNAIAKVLPQRDRRAIRNALLENLDGYSKLFTDGARNYDGMGFYFEHHVINHAFEYVRGNVHTNRIENFWSLLKRGLKGTYVSVSPDHLQRYVEEQVFRFNNRKGTDGERFTSLLSTVSGHRLQYRTLIGK